MLVSNEHTLEKVQKYKKSMAFLLLILFGQDLRT